MDIPKHAMPYESIISDIYYTPNPSVHYGIEPFSLNRLPPVCVIAGRNGSGKTRALRAIKSLVDQIEHQEADIQNLRERIELCEQHAEQAMRPDDRDFQRRKAAALRSRLKARKSIEISSTLVSPALVRSILITPVVSEFNSISNARFGDIAALRSLISGSRTGEIAAADTLLLLEILVRDFLYTTHHSLGKKHPPGTGERETQRYESLQKTIDLLTSLHLDYTEHGYASLDGMLLERISPLLSPGQKRLIHVACLLHIDQLFSRPIVLLLDEPEAHLHPSATIDALERIRMLQNPIQIFLATHSLPLIAYTGADNVWWMDRGRLRFGSGETAEYFAALLGDQNQVDRLIELAAEPFRRAQLTFISECIDSPAVASHRTGDPQQVLLERSVGETGAARPVRLLDFGAGAGRLLAHFSEKHGQQLTARMDYIAYDTPGVGDAAYGAQCKDLIERTYGSVEGRYFTAASDLRAKLVGSPVDVVVLCNVLHEIDVADLTTELVLILEMIKPDGALLVAEDMAIPHGEMPNESGFVIYDEHALAKLLQMPGQKRPAVLLHPDPRYAQRLKAFRAARSDIRPPTNASIVAALREVVRRSEIHLREIARTPIARRSKQLGRLYALHSIQFTNASLALKRAKGH